MTRSGSTVPVVSPYPGDEYASRIGRLQAEMASRRIDALILTEHANFEYLTGVRVPPLWSSLSRVLAAIVTAEGRLEVVLPAFVANEVRAPDAVVHGYGSVVPPPVDQVASILRSNGLSRARIGIERGSESRMGMPLAAVDALKDLMPAVDFVDGSSAMWAVRSTKSTSEIARLRGACLANAAGFRAGFEAPALGMREDEIANRILVGALGSNVAETACVEVGWIAATSGPSGYDRFVAAPRPRRLESGDMLWADLGMTVDGYWSDYCRAAVIGGPTQRQSDRQARIAEATAAGVAMARPGVAVADIARAVRAAMSRLGLPELAFGRVGHGIGVNATEPPSVVEDDRTVLEVGMVITIEPAATLDDGLYCAEQVVVVGDTPEVISPSPVELSHI